VSSRINWEPYFEYIIGCVMDGQAIDTDWTGTIDTESVLLTDLNTAVAAEGTAEKIEEVKAGLMDGSIHAFDTSLFTVGGETLTSYKADVDTDAAYEADTEVIADGYFHESEYRSAPYFDVRIDGITTLNEKF
ncbi:MAG: BMP family ABC transporter substrate-binding protein, partial [Lachnospiraceae bacterium]|nr:BMP family ABC transporter substrate-binding protein [Lachnospiraceae bacterium]